MVTTNCVHMHSSEINFGLKVPKGRVTFGDSNIVELDSLETEFNDYSNDEFEVNCYEINLYFNYCIWL